MVKKKNILVVEDDKNISKLLRYNLEKSGFNCFSVITGEDALEFLDVSPVDLIILDVMLPKMDGFETCKQIRKEDNLAAVPIIFLTAKGEEVDRIVGFELGADDYVVKPFSPRELILRVKAIINRGKPVEDDRTILSVGNLVVDIARHKVLVEKKEVLLTMMEFKLLVLLLKRIGRVQSRESLLNDVWDISSDVTTRTIDTHIKRLRQKIGRSAGMIETVRGLGYRFKDDEE
ncbi:MAG: response regulator transcription factor [Candidatus Omnitrophica bacterium]|nr:response regulator transcription factor [Candidatus Omnitrophota bacterium]